LPKFTASQRRELSSLVTQAMVRRFTGPETKAYVQKVMGITISEDWLRHVCANIKRDRIAELNILRKDQYAFVHACFWNRVDEWNQMQHILHHAIANESNRQEDRDNDVIVHAVNSLNDISDKLFRAYTWLADVAHGMTQQQPPYPLSKEPEPLGPSPINPSQPHPTELDQNEEPIL
jgi:hypothetical protein